MKKGSTGGYLDRSREIAAVRRHGGGRRHGEEEENGELGHGIRIQAACGATTG